MLKIKNEIELNELLDNSNKLSKINIIHEILNDYVENDIYDENENELILYNIDEYDIDDLFYDLNIDIEIVDELFDDNLNEFIIKINDDEFIKKDIIENYDELLKYYHENILIDKISYNLIEFNDKFDQIGMNLYYDYIHKFNYLTSNYYIFDIDDNNDDNLLLDKIRNIFNDEFLYDIELIDDLNELYDEIIELYKYYDIEIDNYYNIIVNHNNNTIRNINNDNLYELLNNIIGSYLKLNDNVEFDYENIIKLINTYSYNIIIVEFNDELYKIEIEYNYVNYKINYMNKLLKYVDELNDIYDLYEYDDENINVYDIIKINYENVDELFNVDDLIEFIDNNIEIDYDLYNYENYVELNNIFYNIFKNNFNDPIKK